MLQTIEIYRESGKRRRTSYRAVRGRQQAEGETPGQALDSLEKLLSAEEKTANSLIVLQRFQPDAFFSEPQQTRLQELMTRFHESINADAAISPDERAELERLVDAEWMAAIARTRAMITQTDQALKS